MLHLMDFVIPLFCFVGKCFLIYVVFKVYVYGTNTSVLWRSVIGFIHETVLALVVCKYSIAVVFILAVNWSKIKHKKSQLLGPVSLVVLLTCLGKGIYVTHSSKPQQAGMQSFWCKIRDGKMGLGISWAVLGASLLLSNLGLPPSLSLFHIHTHTPLHCWSLLPLLKRERHRPQEQNNKSNMIWVLKISGPYLDWVCRQRNRSNLFETSWERWHARWTQDFLSCCKNPIIFWVTE